MTYQGTVDRAPSLPSMPCQNHREGDGDRPMNAGSSYSLGTKKMDWFVLKQSKLGLFHAQKTNLALFRVQAIKNRIVSY